MSLSAKKGGARRSREEKNEVLRAYELHSVNDDVYHSESSSESE